MDVAPKGLPGVAGELDVLLGAGEEVAVGDRIEVLADTGGVTLAGGDDGLEVGDLLVLAADGLGGTVLWQQPSTSARVLAASS